MSLPEFSSVPEIQDVLKGLPQVSCPVFHHFSDGCYAREIHIPKGAAVTGALHKTNHLFVISKGKMLLRTGDDSRIVSAPYHGYTYPGDKRFVYAFEDSVFTTFHVTELTDPDEIAKSILGEEL